MHGGAAPQVVKKARERLAMAADDAASWLVKMMGDETVPWSERRRAMEAILDRAGISRSVDIDLSVDTPWSQMIAGLVAEVPDDATVGHAVDYADRHRVISGEVVTDRAAPVEPSKAAVRKQLRER